MSVHVRAECPLTQVGSPVDWLPLLLIARAQIGPLVQKQLYHLWVEGAHKREQVIQLNSSFS